MNPKIQKYRNKKKQAFFIGAAKKPEPQKIDIDKIPGLLGWLKGNVDIKRMEKLKLEHEQKINIKR